MKLVHAADLHLDSPLTGLERYEGAPVEQIRGATREALTNLVDLCLDEDAALLLLAGDLFDGDWKDYSTGLFFSGQMSRLREAGVRVALVRGNHDATSQIQKRLKLPDNVHELSSRRPETFVYEDLAVAVHGQSFAKRAVTKDLAAGYPEPIPDLLNIGLLHTCVNGRVGHEPYAPCSLETLKNRGYDYWALGHVHTREVLHRDPWIVFPGNLQGRHMREAGDKGATLISVEDGAIVEVSHQSLDVVRFCQCSVDAAGLAEPEDVVDEVREHLERELAAAEGRTLAARVTLTGSSPSHGALSADPERWINQIRAAANDIGAGSVWLESVRLQTLPLLDIEALRRGDDAVGELLRSIQALRGDETRLTELAEAFSSLRHRLPAELRSGDDAIALDDPAYLASALDDVEALLLTRLVSEGST